LANQNIDTKRDAQTSQRNKEKQKGISYMLKLEDIYVIDIFLLGR
jgi:hypothetical protein